MFRDKDFDDLLAQMNKIEHNRNEIIVNAKKRVIKYLLKNINKTFLNI